MPTADCSWSFVPDSVLEADLRSRPGSQAMLDVEAALAGAEARGRLDPGRGSGGDCRCLRRRRLRPRGDRPRRPLQDGDPVVPLVAALREKVGADAAGTSTGVPPART